MIKTIVTSLVTLLSLAAATPAFAGIYYLKSSKPLNGGTYECIYDVGGRDMVNYQQWNCKPSIEM